LKIKFFFIGKTKEKFFLESEENFLKYLKKFCQTEIKIFKEETK
jgi:23S rRNA pseudoU1915 N3-methylase RlmH